MLNREDNTFLISQSSSYLTFDHSIFKEILSSLASLISLISDLFLYHSEKYLAVSLHAPFYAEPLSIIILRALGLPSIE